MLIDVKFNPFSVSRINLEYFASYAFEEDCFSATFANGKVLEIARRLERGVYLLDKTELLKKNLEYFTKFEAFKRPHEEEIKDGYYPNFGIEQNLHTILRKNKIFRTSARRFILILTLQNGNLNYSFLEVREQEDNPDYIDCEGYERDEELYKKEPDIEALEAASFLT